MQEIVVTNSDVVPMCASAYSRKSTLESIVEQIKSEYLDVSQLYPWIIGFSGGKDSTLVAHAVFEAILDVPPYKRLRKVHIISNDTLVESPLVITHLCRQQEKIQEASVDFNLPISVSTTKPPLANSFWTLLIGKGYPSPNQTMRWCTDRLKILPTSRFILDNVSKHGAAIVVLGVRKDESNSRKNTIEKYRNLKNSNLCPHNGLPGAFVYRPIVDISTDQVWEILGKNDPPWGGTHEDLIQLYRDAEGGECPMVLSINEAPGCGTASSRFGCWVCTVVEKDKSLQGFVDSGKSEYQALIDFRDWLKSIRNDPEYRQVIRRNGALTFDISGKHIPGPFTIIARKKIFDRLIETQKVYGSELISKEEIDLINSIWAKELVTKNSRRGGVTWR